MKFFSRTPYKNIIPLLAAWYESNSQFADPPMPTPWISCWSLMHCNMISCWSLMHCNMISCWSLMHCNMISCWSLMHCNIISCWSLMHCNMISWWPLMQCNMISCWSLMRWNMISCWSLMCFNIISCWSLMCFNIISCWSLMHCNMISCWSLMHCNMTLWWSLMHCNMTSCWSLCNMTSCWSLMCYEEQLLLQCWVKVEHDHLYEAPTLTKELNFTQLGVCPLHQWGCEKKSKAVQVTGQWCQMSEPMNKWSSHSREPVPIKWRNVVKITWKLCKPVWSHEQITFLNVDTLYKCNK